MCESMATVGFLELEIWCTKVSMIFHREPLCITRDQ